MVAGTLGDLTPPSVARAPFSSRRASVPPPPSPPSAPGLKQLGLNTWFDEERMTGQIVEKMCGGIDARSRFTKGVLEYPSEH
jgi:hypothetical protein